MNGEPSYFLGRAVNDGSQRSGGRSGSVLGGELLSLVAADLLLNGLAEPGFHSLGPILVEVLVGDDCAIEGWFNNQTKEKQMHECLSPLLCFTILTDKENSHLANMSTRAWSCLMAARDFVARGKIASLYSY
jgi:hypothetical protein